MSLFLQFFGALFCTEYAGVDVMGLSTRQHGQELPNYVLSPEMSVLVFGADRRFRTGNLVLGLSSGSGFGMFLTGGFELLLSYACSQITWRGADRRPVLILSSHTGDTLTARQI